MTFSEKQRIVLNWWRPSSRYAEKEAIICDGAVRSGKTLCMGLIVFIVSNLWGNRIGAKIAAAQCDPARDHPTFCRLLRQAGTVAIMCPSMCLIGSILFQLLPGRAPAAELPAVWLGTLLKNLPMAFFWNMFAAAPFTRWLFRVLCPEKSPAQPAA